MTDAVTTADPEGIQCRGFSMPDGGLFGQGAELARAGEIDPQQAAPSAGSRSRSRGDPDPVEEIAELDFGPVQNRGVTPVTRNASKTAGEPPLRHAWVETYITHLTGSFPISSTWKYGIRTYCILGTITHY